MTATVGTLLDASHALAWGLCSREGVAGGEDRAGELLAAWPQLAAATLRVLDAVALDPAWLDDTGAVRDVLAALALRPRNATPDPAAATRAPLPDRDVRGISVRLGLIADLLAGEPPAGTEVDRPALAGLHANVAAVVHAVALTTLAALEVRSETVADRWLMRGVLIRTERFAVRPTALRAGRYEDLAALPSDGSLDAVTAGWVKATVDVLSSRQRVTQAALQVAAGDALILTATAATVYAAASRVGVVPADRAAAATTALTAAHAAWRALLAWPATVRLEGVRDLGHTQASRALRQVVTEHLREGREWLPADVLAERFDLGDLLGTMRRGLHAVGNVALAHFQAMETLVRGPGRLWMAASAVTQPAYRGYATIEAASRNGWVPMPPLEPAGAALLADAKRALTFSTRAVAALDATTGRLSASAAPAVESLRWEGGRIVAHPAPSQAPLFEIVRSTGLSGAREQRRAPVPVAPRRHLGPRR